MVRAFNWSTQKIEACIAEGNFTQKCKKIYQHNESMPPTKYLAIYDLETYHVASQQSSSRPKETPLIGIYRDATSTDNIDSLPDIFEISVSVYDFVPFILSEDMPKPIASYTYTKKNARETTGNNFAVWRTVHLMQKFLKSFSDDGIYLMAHNGFNYDHRIILAHSISKKLKLHEMNNLYFADSLAGIRAYPVSSRTNSNLFHHCFPEENFVGFHTAAGDVYTTSKWVHKLRNEFNWKLWLSKEELLLRLR